MPIQTTVVGSYPKPPDEGQTFTVRKTLHALERGDATADDLRRRRTTSSARSSRSKRTPGSTSSPTATPGGTTSSRRSPGTSPASRSAGCCAGSTTTSTTGARSAPGRSSGAARRRSTLSSSPPSDGEPPREGGHPRPGYVRPPLGRRALRRPRGVRAGARHGARPGGVRARGRRGHDDPDRRAGAARAPEDLELAIEADRDRSRASSKDGDETILATYFGDAKRLGTELFDIPVDGFGFDLISGPENMRAHQGAPDDKKIQAGIVDARNTRLEDVDELRRDDRGARRHRRSRAPVRVALVPASSSCRERRPERSSSDSHEPRRK